MPGFMPGIHDLKSAKTWMAGTSPAMTPENRSRYLATAFAATIGRFTVSAIATPRLCAMQP